MITTDHIVKGKEVEKLEKYQRTLKIVEHEVDRDTKRS